jgi:hypothetical protein
LLVAVFGGGVIVGFAYWARLPGPFHVSGGPRAVDAPSLRAADWVHDHLSRDSRIASSNSQQLLNGSYARAYALSAINGENMAPLFFSAAIGPAERAFISRAGVEFVAPDLRMSRQLPLDLFYIERGEPNGGAHRVPLRRRWLTKWERMPGVSKVYDGGPIDIYDVRGVARAG